MAENVDIFYFDDIFIKCVYDSYEMFNKSKKKKLKHLLKNLIPKITENVKHLNGKITFDNPFYLLDFFPLKREVDLGFQRTKWRNGKIIGESQAISRRECGFLVHYRFMGSFLIKEKMVKRLNDIMERHMNENDLINKCGIYWSIETSKFEKTKERKQISKEKTKLRATKMKEKLEIKEV